MKRSRAYWDQGMNALADAIPYGHLLAATNPLELFLSVARRIVELEAELKARDERRCETCRHIVDVNEELGTKAWCRLESDECAPNGFHEWEVK